MTLPALVPDDFSVPRQFHAAGFQLQVLSPAHAEADFDAVRTSADRIRHVFGPHNGWPVADLSFEENLADLSRHAGEFERREAFAYALLDPGGTAYLGCLYLKPIKSRLADDRRKRLFQAQAFFWLSEAGLALDAEAVQACLARWLQQDWPFAAVAFPGRVQGWAAWEAMAAPAA